MILGWVWLRAVILGGESKIFGWRKWWFWHLLQHLLLSFFFFSSFFFQFCIDYLYEFVYGFDEFLYGCAVDFLGLIWVCCWWICRRWERVVQLLHSENVFSPQFSSRFGRKKIGGPGRKIFSWLFHPPFFPSLPKQWKTLFFTPFSTHCFSSSL